MDEAPSLRRREGEAVKYPKGCALALVTKGGHIANKGAIVELMEYDALRESLTGTYVPHGYLVLHVISGENDAEYARKSRLASGGLVLSGFHYKILKPLTSTAAGLIRLAKARCG